MPSFFDSWQVHWFAAVPLAVMNRRGSPVLPPFDALSKASLRLLADGLLVEDAAAVAQCILFIEAETLGLWHGRARAMMSRRLKHRSLTPEQRDRLLDAITRRLLSGQFSEQFKDQLRLALYLDADRVYLAAEQGLRQPAAHVRRYAAWILLHKRVK